MMTYAAARDALVKHLRHDAAAQEAAQEDTIGRAFDSVEYHFPRGDAPELGRLHVALTFWDGWIDARNHGWPAGPIARTAWPELARSVAADLAADRELTAALVLAHFDVVAHPRLNERVQTLATRLRARSPAVGHGDPAA
ncbi:MAG TPA: hypothetical protein VFY16_07960 [Gemmatimonadaceae bacterium]|nr:hypothetical protein [Gemmatimonadaceae bacterium]